MKRSSRIARLAAFFLLLCLLAGCGKKPREIRGIQSLRFAYTCGLQATDQVYYTLEKKGSGYLAGVKPQGIDPSDPLTVQVDEEFVRQVEELLRTNHVEEWYGYKGQAAMNDGLGFTFSLKLNGGKEVEAVGFMSWPEGYNDVLGGMESLFMGLWEASGQEAPGA